MSFAYGGVHCACTGGHGLSRSDRYNRDSRPQWRGNGEGAGRCYGLSSSGGGARRITRPVGPLVGLIQVAAVTTGIAVGAAAAACYRQLASYRREQTLRGVIIHCPARGR